MKLGILGGSFDPIHFGHLIAARDALEDAGLDQILFVPAAQAPLRADATETPALHRLRLIEAAIADEPRFHVSDLEVLRGGTSYTIDTVRALKAQRPADELFWIIGWDQVEKLHAWHQIEELAKLVTFLSMERPGFSGRLSMPIPGLRLLPVEGRAIEMSSSEIRERLQRGLSVDFLLPHKAIAYLRENRLYC